MRKAEILHRLFSHVDGRRWRMRGEASFAEYFHWWLSQQEIPRDKQYVDIYDLFPYLPQLAVDAWEDMRTGIHMEAIRCRSHYEEELSCRMVALPDIGDILEQGSAVHVITYVLEAAAGDDRGKFVRSEVESYCRAQSNALQGKFDQFVRSVYRKGLFEIIDRDNARGMSGKFGSTDLRAFIMAGRLILTFTRPKKRKEGISISFVADEDDPLALSAGISCVDADLPAAFSMIEDVIARWPKDRVAQKRIFGRNDEVAPPVVLAARARAKARA